MGDPETDDCIMHLIQTRLDGVRRQLDAARIKEAELVELLAMADAMLAERKRRD